MTNRELLQASKETLGSLEQQRQYVLRVALTLMPCPACEKPVDAITAANLDIDDFDFGGGERVYHCPYCQAELEYVVPLMAIGPGWHWRLNPAWLKVQLAKAQAYDQLTTKKEAATSHES